MRPGSRVITPSWVFSSIALALTLASTAAAASSVEDSVGSVCVGPVPKATPGAPSLSNPTGELPYDSYSVQVDSQPAIRTAHEASDLIEGLQQGARHLVKIRAEGKLVESFWFTFEARGSAELCLWFKPLYRTWSLWPASEAKHLCSCSPGQE